MGAAARTRRSLLSALLGTNLLNPRKWLAAARGAQAAELLLCLPAAAGARTASAPACPTGRGSRCGPWPGRGSKGSRGSSRGSSSRGGQGGSRGSRGGSSRGSSRGGSRGSRRRRRPARLRPPPRLQRCCDPRRLPWPMVMDCYSPSHACKSTHLPAATVTAPAGSGWRRPFIALLPTPPTHMPHLRARWRKLNTWRRTLPRHLRLNYRHNGDNTHIQHCYPVAAACLCDGNQTHK
jgi:hypothetical protein